MLRCRDLSVTISIVRVHSAGHFLLAENEHAHYITTTWPSGPEEEDVRVAVSYDFPWLSRFAHNVKLVYH